MKRVTFNPVVAGLSAAFRETSIADFVIERMEMERRTEEVFSPIETVLDRLERDGTVDVQGRRVIFKELRSGEWYDMPEAMRGVAELHDLASNKHGIPADTSAMWKLAANLDAGSPIFEADIAAVRSSIFSCKRQAMQLRVSQADALIRTVQISAELDRMKGRAA